MKKSPKQIRKILNLNATQIDTLQGNYRSKNMDKLLDDYDLTSHLISLVNMPTATEFYNAKPHGLFAVEQLYQKAFRYLTSQPITHYWQFFDK